MTGRAYVHGRIADTSLAEIHEEMSEILDKQGMYKKCLKIFRGSHKFLQVCEKSMR